MTVTDESLEFLARSFPKFKALSLWMCDGFSTDGLASIATHSKNLVELSLKEDEFDDKSGGWLSCLQETFTSLEILNFANMNSDVDFDSLERLLSRCKSLKVLKVNKNVTLEQLERLLSRAPDLVDLGTGSFKEHITGREYEDLCGIVETKCTKLQTLSGLWDHTARFHSILYSACVNLTFLDLSDASVACNDFCRLVAQCPNLLCIWVPNTVEDKQLMAIGLNCHMLEELCVFFADPIGNDILAGVTENGLSILSFGCPRYHSVVYFYRHMTNADLACVVRNCPAMTQFCICTMDPHQADYVTDQPMDEGCGAVVKTSDLAFECIGEYGKNLETLLIGYAGATDRAMHCLLDGCPNLKQLEILGCPFGDTAILHYVDKYYSMRTFWMSSGNMTKIGCRIIATQMPMLNVEVMVKEHFVLDEEEVDNLYIYRSLCGPRSDVPPFVITL